MPAALLTAKLSAEVRMFLRGNPTPTRVVEQLNHQFEDGGLLDLYITFLLVVLDVEAHRMSVVNAGHPCPLIRRRDGRLEEFGRSASGLPLAIMPNYRYETGRNNARAGRDRRSVYRRRHRRDELRRRSIRRHGVSGRRSRARGPAPQRLARPSSRPCRRHVADRPQFDDITLVCLARK